MLDGNEDSHDPFLVKRLALRLRIPVSYAATGEAYSDCDELLHGARDGQDLFDIVDALLLLAHEAGGADDHMIEHLNLILDDGGSAFHVGADRTRLEHRVAPAVIDASRMSVETAASSASAGSAADHLAAAWGAAYGRRPDPTRSYSEAIKAVEAAAHAVLQPKHGKATLGTMLGEIKGVRHKLTVAIPTQGQDQIAPVEAMMRMLWEGQTARHGSQTPTRPETLEAARMAVHLAIPLVQWFTTGAVARQP